MTGNGISVAPRRARSRAGYSLVEVMAALVILGLAMTAVFATFTTQQQSFTAQSRVAEMQMNLRIAVDYMSRDLRMAGYGIPDNVDVPSAANAAGFSTIRSLFAVDNNAGPDQIYVLYRYDMDANQPADNVLVTMTGVGSVTTANPAVGFLPAGGELVVVADLATADIFQTTSVAGSVLTFGGTYVPPGPINYGTGPPPAVVAKARFLRYFIDGSDPAHPTLMVDRNIPGQAPQPVADDIEDLQMTYGVDADADGIIDSAVGAWSSAPPGDLSRIRQIRLMLVARSRTPDRNWSETRPALGNHAGGASPDGYRRRISDVVIDLRNSGAGT